MDINDLKISEVIYTLQEEAIEKIKEFKDLNFQIAGVTNPLRNKKMQALKAEFAIFFEGNGFKVISTNPEYQQASNDVFTIRLYEDDLQSAIGLIFEIKEKNIRKIIEVHPTKQCFDLLSWRNNLNDINVDSIWRDSFSKEIKSIFSEEKLIKINQELEENINWYKTTLVDTSSINYVFRIYDEDVELQSFEEFFNSI